MGENTPNALGLTHSLRSASKTWVWGLLQWKVPFGTGKTHSNASCLQPLHHLVLEPAKAAKELVGPASAGAASGHTAKTC